MCPATRSRKISQSRTSLVAYAVILLQPQTSFAPVCYPLLPKRYHRNIMYFYQIAEKSGRFDLFQKIADSKRCFLICFQDSRNGLFSQGPEAIFLSLARQGGGSPLCPIRRSEAKTEEAPCGAPLKKCAATYFSTPCSRILPECGS